MTKEFEGLHPRTSLYYSDELKTTGRSRLSHQFLTVHFVTLNKFPWLVISPKVSNLLSLKVDSAETLSGY